MSDFSKMGERIKTLRYKKSMTLGDLANIVGVSKTSISKYENDKATPKAEILEKLALALDTTPAYIMGWEDEEPAETEINPLMTIAAHHDSYDFSEDLALVKKVLALI